MQRLNRFAGFLSSLGLVRRSPGWARLCLAAAVLSAAGPAWAANANWTGNGLDALWSNTANWSASPVPGTGNTATFNSAGNSNTVIDLTGSIVVQQITFDTANVGAYTIGSGGVGNQTLAFNAGGVTMNNTVANDQLFNANLVLGAAAGNQSYTFTNNDVGSLLSFAGGISSTTTGTKTLTVTGAGNTTIGGAMTNGTGSLALTKSGAGILTLSNTGNTFSGDVGVTAGTLRSGANNAMPHGTNQWWVPGGTGTIDLNGFNDTTPSSTRTGGGASNVAIYFGTNTVGQTMAIATGAGTLTLAGNIGQDSNSFGSKLISGNLSLGSATRTIGSAGGGVLTISAVISGDPGVGLTIAGGTELLSGANTYTGATTLTGGTTQIGVGNGLGSVVGTITSSAIGTGTLTFNGGGISSDGATARTILNAVSFTGNGTIGNATNNGALTFSAGVNLGGAGRTITVNSNAQFDGIVTNGGITKAGAGTLILNHTGNNFTSGTGVSAGVLRSGASDVLPDGSELAIGGTGTIDLAGFSDTVNGSGGNAMFLGVNAVGETATLSTGAGTLTLGGNIRTDSNAFGNALISGNLNLGNAVRTVNIGVSNNAAKTLTISANISSGASGGLNYSGTNTTLLLSGTNSYTGGTTVGGSATLIWANTGAQPASGTTTVSAGGILAPRIGGAAGFATAALDNLFANTMTNVSMNATALVGIDTTNGDLAYGPIGASTRGLAKIGPNTLTLTGNNAYTGSTIVNGGMLVLAGNNSASSGATTINGATLRATAANSLPTGTLTLGTNGTVELRNDSSTVFTSPGNIAMANNSETIGNGTIFVGPAVGSSATGGIHTVTQVTNSGSRYLTVAGANGYSLTIGTYSRSDTNNNYIAALTDLTINQFNGGKTRLYAAGGANIAVLNTTVNGDVWMNGAGTVTFAGNFTNSGGFEVQNGLVKFNANKTSTGVVTVNGGYLAGTGTINTAVTVSAGGINLVDGAVAVTPLTLSNNLAITGAAGANNLKFDLGAGTAGTDRISVTGTTTVTTAGAAVVTLNQIGGIAKPSTPGSYTLIDGTGAMDPVTDFALATSKAFGQTFALSVSGDNDLQVTTATGTAGPAAAFWKGGANNWSTVANWNTDATSQTGTGAIPGYETNVTFYTTTPAAGQLTSNLVDVDFDINSLNYSAAATSATTIGGSKMLTIEAAAVNGNAAGRGITVATPTSGTPTHTISAKVGLASNQTWFVDTGAKLTVSGAISDFNGGRSLTKDGAGTLTLSSASNNYFGGTVVNAGTLVNGAAGAVSGALTINTGGILATDQQYSTSSAALVQTININGGEFRNTKSGNGNSDFLVKSIDMTGGSLTTTGATPNFYSFFDTYSKNLPINTHASSSVATISAAIASRNITGITFTTEQGTTPGGVDLVVSGPLFKETRNGNIVWGITKEGAGVMAITSNNDLLHVGYVFNTGGGNQNGYGYDGPTTINGGTLQLGNNTSTGSLNPNSAIVNNATLAFKRTDTLTQGTDFNSVISGSGGVVQAGSGTTILNGVNTYAGATTVNAGSLLVNSPGSLSALSAVSVAGNASLGGTGTINGAITVNSTGHLSPGPSGAAAAGIGTLTVGSLDLKAGSVLDYYFDNVDFGDFARVNNTLTLPTTDSVSVTLNGTIAAGNVFDLIQYGSLVNPFDASQLDVGNKTEGLSYVFSIDETGSTKYLRVTVGSATGNRSTLSVFPSSVADFRVLKGGTDKKTLTLTNTYASDDAEFSAAAAGQVTTTDLSGSVAKNNGTATVQVGYTDTTTVGSRSGSITLNNTLNTSDPFNPTVVSISGAVVEKRSLSATEVVIPGVFHAGADLSGTNYPTTVSTAGADDSYTRVTVAGSPVIFNGGAGTGSSQTRSLAGPASVAIGGGTLASLDVTTAESGLGDTYTSLSVLYTASVYSGAMTWSSGTGGNWGTNAKWTDSVSNGASMAPGLDDNYATSDTAAFEAPSAPATVTLNSVQPSLNALSLAGSGANVYTIDSTGGGSLTLAGAGASVTVGSGSHEIAAPVALGSATGVDVADSSALTVSGLISGNDLTKTGPGTLTLTNPGNSYAGTTVTGGTLVIGAAGALPSGRSLSIGSGGTLILGGGMAMGASAEPVPEPGTLALLAIAGLAGVMIWRKRK